MTNLYATINTLYRLITEPSVDELLARPGFYRRLNQMFRSVLRTATRVQKAEDRAELKQAMLSDPDWRERVIYDLGGEAALTRWEVKEKKSRLPKAETPPKIPDPSEIEANIRLDNRSIHHDTFYDRVKVDQEGQFRLAPITRENRTTETREVVTEDKPHFDLPKVKYTSIDPIPVTPGELRKGVPSPESQAEHANAMAALKETAARATAMADELVREARFAKRSRQLAAVTSHASAFQETRREYGTPSSIEHGPIKKPPRCQGGF